MICTWEHEISLNLVSPLWKLLELPLWRSLRTSYFSVPMFLFPLATSPLPFDSEMWNFPCVLPPLLSVPYTLGSWWANSILPLTSSHIICELKTLKTQSPVCTCPLLMSTWMIHKSLITSQMESPFIIVPFPTLPIFIWNIPDILEMWLHGAKAQDTMASLLAPLPVVLLWISLRQMCCLDDSRRCTSIVLKPRAANSPEEWF